jgi:hypothetical protein
MYCALSFFTDFDSITSLITLLSFVVSTGFIIEVSGEDWPNDGDADTKRGSINNRKKIMKEKFFFTSISFVAIQQNL